MNQRVLAALAMAVMLLALLGMYMSQKPKIPPNTSLNQLEPTSLAADWDHIAAQNLG